MGIDWQAKPVYCYVQQRCIMQEANFTLREYEAWFRVKVEAGRQAIREGRALAHEEVMARQTERRSRLLVQAGQQMQ